MSGSAAPCPPDQLVRLLMGGIGGERKGLVVKNPAEVNDVVNICKVVSLDQSRNLQIELQKLQFDYNCLRRDRKNVVFFFHAPF